MAISVFKTFSPGEILTASDLNSSFTQITDNGEDLAWPATKAKDFNGQELILDANGNTSITADTDDQIDIRIAGADDFKITANIFTALSGSAIATNTITETTSGFGVTIDGILLKNGGANPTITGGDSDGVLSITADTAIDQGGNIKIYGNTHSTKAQDIEFYADATLILSWDEDENNWDFEGENVTGVGTLAAGATVITSGTASGGTANAAADDFVIDANTNVGASIIGSDAADVRLVLGSASLTQGVIIRWNHNGDTFDLGSIKAGASTILTADAFVTNLTLSGGSGSETAAFAGIVGIGKSPTAGSALDINLATEDLEIIDAGSVAATQQDWIEVEVAGNQGYIHVFAAK